VVGVSEGSGVGECDGLVDGEEVVGTEVDGKGEGAFVGNGLVGSRVG